VFPKTIQQPLLQLQGHDSETPRAGNEQPTSADEPCTGQELLDERVLIRGEPEPVRPVTDSQDAPIRPSMGKPGPMKTGGLAAFPDPGSEL
jgi:hypothetical protein